MPKIFRVAPAALLAAFCSFISIAQAAPPSLAAPLLGGKPLFSSPPPTLNVYVASVSELKNAMTYYRTGPLSVGSDTRHVLRLSCGISGGWTSQNSSLPAHDVGGIDSGKTIDHSVEGAYQTRTSSLGLGVVAPGELGTNLAGEGPVPTSATTTADGLGVGLDGPGYVPVQISSTGVLSGSNLTIVAMETRDWHVPVTYYYTDSSSSTVWTYHSESNFKRIDVNITKLMCGDASVDTRRMFGQPNRDGVVVPDANEPLRNVKFGTWQYKGGLFVGNMPPNSTDQSGTSRAQFYVPSGGTGTLVNGCLTVADAGQPSALSSTASIGLFIPQSTDPNLAVTEANVNWATRWDIEPYNPISLRYDTIPVTTQSLSGASTNDYVSWSFLPSSAVLPTGSLNKLCLALTNEPTDPSGLSAVWRYFVGKEFSDKSALGFPGDDCLPRVWRIGQTGGSIWQHVTA